MNSSERRSQFVVIDTNCQGLPIVSASGQNRSDVHAVAADAVVRAAPYARRTFNEGSQTARTDTSIDARRHCGLCKQAIGHRRVTQ